MTLPCSQRAKLENRWQSVFGSIREYPRPRLTCGAGRETAIVDRFLSGGRPWHPGHFDPTLSMVRTAEERDLRAPRRQ